MLEIKNLSKVYKPKKGVPVTALNNISLKLPDRGMVFLLGKSGSGKSTLLNLLGGLDRYTSGEIIINGVSSKDFKQNHFDSYRNTYVGFIFQEYNILDEFNVGENIAIAIELQGKKASDDVINNILSQVDLAGYGNRKPNELSGGQKQRVAIARALVKNPEIIMADEPTGALDSNTGKQVLDTLKKLSKEKLIIVVSHDREFADNYADRIIELADGQIIDDISIDTTSEVTADENITFGDNDITIRGGYHLTEDDLKHINEYIDKIKNNDLKINFNKNRSRDFKKTDVENILVDKNKSFKLIKSKLPLHNAFKMGSSGLKHKKFKLVITILLSCIAFGLFGLADTFAAYNHVKVCTNSIYDTNINFASVVKSKKYGDNWYETGNLSDKDIADINKNTGVNMSAVFLPKGAELTIAGNINEEIKTSETDYEIYSTAFSGFTEIDEKTLKSMNYGLVAGRIPDSDKDEIAVSKYIFEVFQKKQYTDGTVVKDSKGKESVVFSDIKDYSDLLDKTVTLNGVKYKITGIVDTKIDLSRYKGLIEKKENQTSAQQILDYALMNEFESHRAYSFASLIMVGKGKLQKLMDAEPDIYNISKGYMWFNGSDFTVDPRYITTIDKIDTSSVSWVNGEKKSLGDKEIIVTQECLSVRDTENAPHKEDGSIDIAKVLSKNNSAFLSKNLFGSNDYSDDDGYKIVGFIPTNEKVKGIGNTVVVSQTLFDQFGDDKDAKYVFAAGNMPAEKNDIKQLVSYCYTDKGNTRYPIQNSVTFELDTINSELKQLAKVFLYIGLGFALFAAVMLANFIGTSISYKKQEIGILRAIGSRSNDVFRIFFSESFIIAMINFILSAVGVLTVTLIINHLIRNNLGILITLLTFGPRQIVLLLFVSIFVAFISSFIPVYRIASKKPIDAIRDR